MHRHGYKGRKFGRETDQRRALMKGLADSLILRESIETTLPKAKEVATYTEKLITKAKIGDLHNRRQIMAKLNTYEAASKLIDELAPKLAGRNSGYLRISKTGVRRGDAAQLAKISFVDDLGKKAPAKVKATPKQAAAKNDKPATKPKQVVRVSKETKSQAKSGATQAAKRTGRRGDR